MLQGRLADAMAGRVQAERAAAQLHGGKAAAQKTKANAYMAAMMSS